MKVLNKYGFTLAELMAVVVIIAIIAGIGLGSYRSAIEKARFNEAIGVASALAAAADEYYYDHVGLSSDPWTTNIDSLALNITDGSVSGSTLTTRNFVYTLQSEKVEAQRINGNYGVIVPLESQLPTDPILCSFTDSSGEEFCSSLGYSCSFSSNGNKKCSD